MTVQAIDLVEPEPSNRPGTRPAGGPHPPHAAPPGLELHEAARLRAAASHARRVLPGPVGELVSRELAAHADLGYRFGVDALIPQLARLVLRMERPAQSPE